MFSLERQQDNCFGENLCRCEVLGTCHHCGLLTRTMDGGEIEAGDLSGPVVRDADQLTLIGDAGTQLSDGVGVLVAG